MGRPSTMRRWHEPEQQGTPPDTHPVSVFHVPQVALSGRQLPGGGSEGVAMLLMTGADHTKVPPARTAVRRSLRREITAASLLVSGSSATLHLYPPWAGFDVS